MAVEAPNLPYARDLQADTAAAVARGVPVLILYSLPACPFCNEIRRAHLLPMLADPAQAKRAIVRQVDLNGPEPMLDFTGRKTTHGDFARALGVRFAPVVAFYGAGARRLGDALTGGMIPDFYAHYLESGLAAATQAMTARPPAK